MLDKTNNLLELTNANKPRQDDKTPPYTYQDIGEIMLNRFQTEHSKVDMVKEISEVIPYLFHYR